MIEEYYFDDFKAAGINAVRLPVTWNQHTEQSAPYMIDSTFINRVEQVVDWALARGLYLCLNAHHEGWLKNTNECINGQCGPTSQNQDRFNAIWLQIAQKFKDKSYNLMFEILNEPETLPTSTLNDIHRRIVQTIRTSGGNNEKRVIVFSGTKYSSNVELVEVDVPADNHTYLIANYHTYCPWSFVSDLSGNARWGSESDKDGLKAIFDMVKNWADQHDISIMFNEWGASFDKHDYTSVMDFYQYYVKAAVDYGFAAIVWDDGFPAGFQTYERKTRLWHGELIDVLTNPMLSANGMQAAGWFDSYGVARYAANGGSHYVGDLSEGHWVAYRLTMSSTGGYKMDLEVSGSEEASLSISSEDGSIQYASVKTPNTGGDQIWTTVHVALPLKVGPQTIAIKAISGKTNLKTIKLSHSADVKVTGVSIDQPQAMVSLNNVLQLNAVILPPNARGLEEWWNLSKFIIFEFLKSHI